ncbi:hypothetical protein [uncultured Clostridium sp.]|uniref:hypothetical protein n=1 Tax=uncultured Clostridium sp. TaxID=59620 RepID=UPI00261C7413|nr:hypothetical protein [uncultured Clostridium sp.]
MRKFVELQKKREFDFLNMKKLIVMIVISSMIPILIPMTINIQDKAKRKEILVAANSSNLDEKEINLESWKKNVQADLVSLKENQKSLYEKYNIALKEKERNELMKIDNEIEYNNVKIRVLEYRLNNEIIENEAGWQNRALNNIIELAKENTIIMKDIEELEVKKNLEKEYNEYKKNFILGKKERATEIKNYWTSLEQGKPIMEDETKIINLNSDEIFKIGIMIFGVIVTCTIIADFMKKVLAKKYY